MSAPLLSVAGLCAAYEGAPVVCGVSFDVAPGQILCIAGESGSGKSTLLRALLGADDALRATGTILWEGQDIAAWPRARRRALWGRGIALIPQDPGASFHPLRSYASQFREMLRSHGLYRPASFRQEVCALFAQLGLEDGERILNSRPFEMSGGMNQRIALAAAMLLRPRLLLADEPTGALDAMAQRQAAAELLRLRDLYGVSQIVVTHHLGLAALVADQLAVMQAGRLVENGPATQVLRHPASAYTRALLEAVPRLPEGG